MFKKQNALSALLTLALCLQPFLSLGMVNLPADQKILKLCREDQSIVLIDVFMNHNPDFGHQSKGASSGHIDVDGDQVTDVLHGDFVYKLLKLNSNNISTYGLKDYDGHSILGAFADLRYFINSQLISKPAAVVMPVSYSLSLEQINKNILLGEFKVTQDNLMEHRDAILKGLRDNVSRKNSLYNIYLVIDDLIKSGVQVIVPAGNNYSKKINMAAFFGAVTVGAYTHRTQKVAPYSDQSGLTKVFRTGDVISRKLEGGVDVNGDGRLDFLASELSGGISVAELYSGLPVPKVLSIDELKQDLSREAFVLSRDFNKSFGVTSETLLNQIDQRFGSLLHYPSYTYFKKTDEGLLTFDPAGDKSTNQVAFNFGTSFALGNLCESKPKVRWTPLRSL